MLVQAYELVNKTKHPYHLYGEGGYSVVAGLYEGRVIRQFWKERAKTRMASNRAVSKRAYKKTELLRKDLLDAAEQLFAEKGFDKTSIRDITDHLGVRLAAVNYHFESKHNLLVEMIHRRAGALNEARQTRLNQVKIDRDKPYENVYALVQAMFKPLVEYYLSGDDGWHYYCRYLARMIGADPLEFRTIINHEYNDIAKTFINKLKEALPEHSDYQLHCAYQFLIGTFMFVMSDNKRLDGISDGRYQSADVDLILNPHFFKFATAGIIGIAESKV